MGTLLTAEPVEGVRLLTLNRPLALNALDEALVRSLLGALDDADADDRCRVLVLAGAGRGFCSGWDVKAGGATLAGEGARPGMRLQRLTAALIRRLRTSIVPVVAAVDGPAVGGGFALAMATDIRLAGPTARFAASFIRLGISGADLGMSWLLPRAVGSSRAFELLLTGRSVDAAEATQMGLARPVEGEDTESAAIQLAAAIAVHSPFAIEMTKEALWANLEIPSLYAAMELENRTQILATTTADHREALAAYRDGRTPRYEGI